MRLLAGQHLKSAACLATAQGDVSWEGGLYLKLLIVEKLDSFIIQQCIYSLASGQVVQLVDLLACLQAKTCTLALWLGKTAVSYLKPGCTNSSDALLKSRVMTSTGVSEKKTMRMDWPCSAAFRIVLYARFPQ